MFIAVCMISTKPPIIEAPPILEVLPYLEAPSGGVDPQDVLEAPSF